MTEHMLSPMNSHVSSLDPPSNRYQMPVNGMGVPVNSGWRASRASHPSAIPGDGAGDGGASGSGGHEGGKYRGGATGAALDPSASRARSSASRARKRSPLERQ